MLRQDGVKGAADSGALAHSGRGEGGVQNVGRACGSRGWRDVAKPEVRRLFFQDIVPGSRDPGSGGLHSLLGGEV